jgi:predicted nucleic acid-binding protein
MLFGLCAELLWTIGDFDSATSYSPPGPFDDLLNDYIRRSPDLSSVIVPAATVVAAGTAMSMLVTLSEVNLAVLQALEITSPPARAVVYTSLVRILFGIGYTLNTAALDGDREQNAAFLAACEHFAGQKVRELVLTQAITEQYTKGLPLRSMFKSKQVDMLRAMTNPIDLMHHVYQILRALAAFFASTEKFLSFDDTLTLLLALMLISPPGNAIAAFVSK